MAIAVHSRSPRQSLSGAAKKRKIMKKLHYAFAAGTLLALSSIAMPARALPAHPIPAASVSGDVVNARYHYVPRRVCTVRTVVTRGYHGRRIVKRVRVCRVR
jgi:hypothetical protein